ncbi:MAG: F0F1 ATP synthase subunit A [Elusimicrobiaceae bacterium]|nr:F0F1 ATP synthase subunit A [Elusimicrobiaceae bacterium]
MDFETVLEHHIIDHTYRFAHVFGLNVPLTKHLAMMWLVGLILAVIVPLVYRSKARALWPLRAAIEGLVEFVRHDIVLDNMGEAGLRYTPYFCTVFFFILGCNLAGLVPYGSTATGNISVTAALAVMSLVFILFAGMREQGVAAYFKTLVPHGVPGWLVPLLFPIELFGLLTKAFALCIRLFANMISGHIVLLSFIMMIFIFAQVNIVVDVLGVIPGQLVMALFVMLLEVFVAFLQAFIFTFLTAIFAGMAMHPH